MQNIELGLDKLTKQQLIVISAIVIVLTGTLTYRKIFRPLQGRIKTISAQILQRKNNILRAQIDPQTLKELEDSLGQLQGKVERYQQMLSAEEDVPQILQDLNQIAERLNIKFSSVTPLERASTQLPGDSEQLMSIPIQIKLSCGYHQLGQFINQIENGPRFMKIMSLKINADSRNVWTHQVELVITSFRLAGAEKLNNDA